MSKLLLLIITFFTFSAWAEDKVTVSVYPKKPLVNETFNVTFKVSAENADAIDDVSFKYPGLTVVGQSQQGISTRTTYINGTLTMTREITVVYEMMASNFGTKYLRDIKVKVGGKVLTHPMVSFEVIKEPETKPDIFVMAEVPKTDYFLGEGLIVRYHLYSRVSVNSLDVKTFPKLNHFLKRYLQEPDRAERVEIDGNIYLRNLIYAAKVFPEKTGKLRIDPLTMSVTYAKSRNSDPYNFFGSPRDLRTRTFSSESIELNVMAWPKPVPADFSGLVGKHDFVLDMNQNKLLVNQPLDVVLTVNGPGALENFEVPKIFESAALEEFEANGELKIQDANLASKIFKFTYLAKTPEMIPSKELTFSYLEPSSGQYVQVKTTRNPLEIGGVARKESRPEEKKKEKSKSNETAQSVKKEEIVLSDITSGLSWTRFEKYINLGLGLIALLLLLGFAGFKFKNQSITTAKIPSSFKKDFSQEEFIKWMSPVITRETKSLKEVINDLEISHEAKTYFVELIDSSDMSLFAMNKRDFKYKYNQKYYKEIAAKIETYNESYS